MRPAGACPQPAAQPVVAFAIDRVLYWIQKELFPYRYGGGGALNRLLRFFVHLWDDLKGLVLKPIPPFDRLAPPATAQEGLGGEGK